ncbi:MAG: 5'-nucleotidase C-terminal domain-containing protein [Nocardioides sp.]
MTQQSTQPQQPSRRTVVTGAAAGVAATAVAATTAAPATAAGKKTGQPSLTVLGTTDLHGNVYNWDYFKNAEFDDAQHNDIGVAKVKTVIDRERAAARGGVLVLDAGDTIQGTPLAYYYAKVQPIGGGTIHPMAKAMNLIGYDAAALGNHEFNYGIPLLRTFESQLNFPLLGANAVDPTTKRPVFAPYVVKQVDLGHGPALKVGILGLTNPGIAIWDKANVEGRMEFPGLVEQAKKFVPELKAMGCDVVIISAHSGADTSSSYGDALPVPENASTLVAQQVPGVDAILVGHAHVDIPQREVVNEQTGKTVLLCEPFFWGKRVARFDFDFKRQGRGWRVVRATSTTLVTNTAVADPSVAAAVQEQHDTVVAYVNSVVGTSAAALSAARSVVEDVPIIDFVNYVQADAVKAGLTGADAALPVLSEAAPFNRAASFPEGNVTIRDVAGLYIYDNTLLGVKVTGAQVKDYLEFSMRYFKQVTGPGPFALADVTNAVTETAPAPNGTPDYNFDTVAGLDAPLTYNVDIAQPVGLRIKNLAYAGVAVDPAQEFVMAINNYRQSGGGGFPHVATAPVVYNRQNEIRQLLIDWVLVNHEIDPADFASPDWKLVSNGSAITVT